MNNQSKAERDSFFSNLNQQLERGLDQMALSQSIERLQRFPYDIDLKLTCCNILMKMGKDDDASKLINELNDFLIKLSRVYMHQGDIHAKNGLYREAVSCYRKYLNLNPHSDIADEVNGKIDVIATRADIGPDETEETAATGSVSSDFKTVTLAELYIQQGHLDMAEEVLKEILDNDPNNTAAAERLQEIKPPEDEKTADAAEPQDAGIIETLGKWLRHLSRLKENAS